MKLINYNEEFTILESGGVFIRNSDGFWGHVVSAQIGLVEPQFQKELESAYQELKKSKSEQNNPDTIIQKYKPRESEIIGAIKSIMDESNKPVGIVRTQMTANSTEFLMVIENPVNSTFGVDDEGSECIYWNKEWHIIEKYKYPQFAIIKT